LRYGGLDIDSLGGVQGKGEDYCLKLV